MQANAASLGDLVGPTRGGSLERGFRWVGVKRDVVLVELVSPEVILELVSAGGVVAFL